MEVRFRINKNLLLALVAFFLVSGFKVYDELFEYSKNLEIFSAAYKEVGKNFVDEVNPGEIMRKGLDAMLESLDPYTNFYSESQAEESLIDRQGEYSGVGCRVVIVDNYPLVTEVFGGYAFSKADIRPGDVLRKISGVSMKGKSMGDIHVFLRGAPDTDIAIEIEREGSSLNKTVTRVAVIARNVPYYGMIDATTGYIKLETFGQKAAEEIKNAMMTMNKDGNLKYLILDLRDNGGGLLDEARDIVGLFVGPNKLVVTMKGKTKESNQVKETRYASAFTNLPLAILVNSRSASASEVVSGSLQDMDRAVIVGRRSFGKGLVQNYLMLPYRTQMKVTIAKYYTPSGRCIQLLDYRHRNADGSAGKVPDSMKTAFKTASGRTVYDGGGIMPDLEVDEFGGQPLLKLMMEERLLFEFANHYRNTHASISPAKEFQLSDADFEKFKTETSEKLLDAVMEKFVIDLKKSLQDADLAEMLGANESMRKSLQKEIDNKIQNFSKILKYQLTQEILKRYYYDAALYESSFSGDPDLASALRVLHDEADYKRRLLP